MVKDDIRISICVPAFNEEKGICPAVEDLLTTLSPAVGELEVIIVNDGSTDLTAGLAGQLSASHRQVKIIHHARKRGIGACYRDALKMARGDYFTWFPADHQNSAGELIRCLQYLREDTVVLCHHRGCDNRSLLRRGLSGAYTGILNRIFHLKVAYYNGLAVFPVRCLRSFGLVADGFTFLAESLIKAIRRGCRVVELPFSLKERAYGRSKALTFFSVRQSAGDILRILSEQNNR